MFEFCEILNKNGNFMKNLTNLYNVLAGLQLFRECIPVTPSSPHFCTLSHRHIPISVSQSHQSVTNLYNILAGLQLFRDFLRSEFSDENLDFWIAVEDFKRLKPSEVPSVAQKIYTDFVAPQSTREVSTVICCNDNVKFLHT